MPRRKPPVKRRMYGGPEMERRLAFMLAHQLHLQETKQQRPFPESLFGSLPGEIRDMIYEYVLVFPPSQSTRYLRNPGITATNSDTASAERTIVATESETGSTEPRQLAPKYHARPAKVSYVAILQTCRQINREAYHIFYARNSFHITNAPDLIAFLQGIGPVRRAELTSLYTEGLVIEEHMSKDFIYDYCLRNSITPAERERLVAVTCPALHPDLCSYPGFTGVFEGCKNLSTLILDMEAKQVCSYLSFLKCCFGSVRSVVYLVDKSHWILGQYRAVDLRHSRRSSWASTIIDKYPFSDFRSGNKFQVEVEIIRGLELEKLLEKGNNESWL